ncbi:MAG: helix-turn-helix domain-containing protein [Alphaproteobacteria bacterium]
MSSSKQIDVAAAQAYARTHTPKETALAFGVCKRTLNRRGIRFRDFKRATSEDLKKAAELVKTMSQRQAAREIGVSYGVLQRRNIGKGRPGRKPPDKKRVVIFNWLVTRRNISARKAEFMVGVSRATVRKYMRAHAQLKS